MTILAKALAGATAGGSGGFAVGGPVDAVVGAAVAPVPAGMRQAGLQKVDDIVADALLNPSRAKLLLACPATPISERATIKLLAQLYR